MTITSSIQRLNIMIGELVDQNNYFNGRIDFFSPSAEKSHDDEIMHYKAKIKRNKKDIDSLKLAIKIITKENVKEL